LELVGKLLASLGGGGLDDYHVGEYVVVILVGDFREPIVLLDGILELTFGRRLRHRCGGQQKRHQDQNCG